MFEQVWTKVKNRNTIQDERSSESWQGSLALKWAVVKFMKYGVARKERGVPTIEHKPDPPREPQKSVNEMLAELRVKDTTNTSSNKNPKSSRTPGRWGSDKVTDHHGMLQTKEHAPANFTAGDAGA